MPSGVKVHNCLRYNSHALFMFLVRQNFEYILVIDMDCFIKQNLSEFNFLLLVVQDQGIDTCFGGFIGV